MDAPHFDVVAKLPLLGPVFGWTGRDGQGGMRSRMWIRVDDAESEPALVALTALCEPGGRVRPGSVQIWKLTRLYPAQTQTHQSLDFAVADVALPPDAGDCAVRMVSLHRITFASAGGPARPVFDERQATPGTIDGLGGNEAVQARLKVSEEAWAEPSTQQRLSGTDLPRPEEVAIAVLLPQLAGKLERLAEQAFRNIDKALADARHIAARPIPGTLSRKRLHVRSLSECEARLSPASRQLYANTRSIAFAVGCCRHPGNGFERDLSGRSLQALASAADSPVGPAFALLTGDQIYADATGGIFDVEERFEKFVARYQRAFDAEAFRAVASRMPLYMAADDHEIGDGFSLDRLRAMNLSGVERAANERAYEWGRTLFYAHQRLHGPDGTAFAGDAGDSPPSLAWYRFEAAGLPFFVMDTRFERDAGVQRLVHDAQQSALEEWLDGLANDAAPKFIVSGAVFAPGLAAYAADPASARTADNWQGFPKRRAWLARQIARRKLENVVFVSGDYHCAAVGALRLFDGEGGSVRAYAIVSPPFFAPYTFANTRACQVCSEETIREPGPRGERGPVAAECRALAVEGQGFAVVRVAEERGGWAIELELRKPQASAGRVESVPYFAARLANGTIDVTRRPA
jgi:hypothetical protein